MSEQQPKTIKLREAVQYYDKFEEKEVTIEQVEVPPRLKAKHMRGVNSKDSEGAQSIALVAGVTGLPVKAVEELDFEDFTAILEAASGPLPNSQEAGKTSSE